jgi:hypothetical protein
MTLLIVALAIASCGLILLAAPFQWKKAQKAHRLLVRYLANTFGLEAQATPDEFGARLNGFIDHLEVTLEAHAVPRHFRQMLAGRRRPLSGGVAYSIEGHGRITSRVGMRRADTKTRVHPEEVTIGDPELDAHVEIYGSEAHALALLVASTRKRVLHLIKDHGVIVQDGRISHFETNGLDDIDRPELLIRGLVELGKRLELTDEEVITRLLENLGTETTVAVRQRLARALFGQYGADPVVLEARPRYENDPDPWIAFYARIADPVNGRAHLEATLSNTEVDLELREWAAERLGQDALLFLLPELQPSPRILERAFVAIGEVGDARAEPVLIKGLDDAETRVRVAAARALGKLGSLSAIPQLSVLRDALPLVIDGELKKAATRSIAEIQARLGHSAAGALSVTGNDERGALSDLEADRGALSEP